MLSYKLLLYEDHSLTEWLQLAAFIESAPDRIVVVHQLVASLMFNQRREKAAQYWRLLSQRRI
jgi:hypothetical protein